MDVRVVLGAKSDGEIVHVHEHVRDCLAGHCTHTRVEILDSQSHEQRLVVSLPKANQKTFLLLWRVFNLFALLGSIVLVVVCWQSFNSFV